MNTFKTNILIITFAIGLMPLHGRLIWYLLYCG